MRLAKKLLILFTASLLLSCEGFIGENGVVIDSETGERISEVIVRLNQKKSSFDEIRTDSNGYFDAKILVGCVLRNCNNYQVSFEKIGYESITINEKFFHASTTEFVTSETKDTLLVSMRPN